MRTVRFAVLPALLLILAQAPTSARAQVTGYAEISLPVAGSAVSGVVTLRGTADHPWFQSYDLAFAYSPNPTETWFPVGDPVRTPVRDDRLGIWDTTGITDGNYTLRLRVWLTDGTLLVGLVEDVRVRNYHPAETPTPAPTSYPSPTPLTPTPTETPWPVTTSTAAPTGMSQARGALAAGVLTSVGGLGLLGVYSLARGPLRSQWAALRTRLMHARLTVRDRRRRTRR
jgi:hypothetical protein